MEEGVGEQVGVLVRVLPDEDGLETGEDLVEGLLHQDSLVKVLGVDHGEGLHRHEALEDLAGLTGELGGVGLDRGVHPGTNKVMLERVLEAGAPAVKVQGSGGSGHGSGHRGGHGSGDGVDGVEGGDGRGVVRSVAGKVLGDILDLGLNADGRAHEVVEVLGRAVELAAALEGRGDAVVLDSVAVGALVGLEGDRAVRVQSGETEGAGESVLALLLLYGGGGGVVHLRDLRGLLLLEEAVVDGVGEEVDTAVAVRKRDVGRELLDRHDSEHVCLVSR